MKFDQTKHLNSEYEENLSSNNSDESKKEDSVIYLSEQSARKKQLMRSREVMPKHLK